MINIYNISKSFKRRNVLNDLSVDFERGCYGLLGPNGAGKTTLIRCILGLYKTDEGSIKVGDDIQIGYLPQNFGMFNELSLKDMMEYFAASKKIPKDKRAEEIEKALTYVNLADRMNDRVSHLSGGMKRRAGIAQAILGNPDVLIFDEPTTGLDPEERARFKEVIKRLREDGKCIIISTHIVDDVEHICDKVVIVKDGHVLINSTVEDVIGKVGLVDATLEQGYLALLSKF
ncbi:ABC transporter ATP-binding protein [Eubacterium xylanophilum]|uniref:ABC transporter ATP-binding protein n=1 Tax=Eubacterium xylanophilum TaxID=39497 RepID=UPI0004B1428F|nr:ABC transporter ATP-binding protein [Eubacterium xylanophilum]